MNAAATVYKNSDAKASGLWEWPDAFMSDAVVKI